MSRNALIAFLLGWAFSMLVPPGKILGMFRGKQ